MLQFCLKGADGKNNVVCAELEKMRAEKVPC